MNCSVSSHDKKAKIRKNTPCLCGWVVYIIALPCRQEEPVVTRTGDVMVPVSRAVRHFLSADV